ncbi:SMC-Scp complex subunit ScpB [Opitutus terrae]|uniref:Segregation and condensation protein B n=1 Tax=Opitutus terrae (strain DSM 11246 / JCM 15787 / PB90-1) TaxID=452637 RepID=B1ZYX8_OPITP|nr:SMC-Scp complex subunit ScpB [Opitutus terrae]ACB76301.1 segregation and condensation protein B [Opitutus terrae PB90-1]
MAFNLKKVLKALLFSSSHPLAIKDIQAAFTRFHDTAALEHAAASEESTEPGESPSPAVEAETPKAEAEPAAGTEGNGEAPAAGEPAEVFAETPADPELYAEVPSLITATQIREAMDQIAAELKAADEGLLLIEGSTGYRLVTHPRFARWVRILRSEPPPVKLSQSSIETLAIVAYRQPVTRGEIETIRGVSAEAGVNKLLERELIYIVGRADLPGRPIQYGTTDKFLEFVGVKSLDELPASDVLSSRQIDEWLKTAMNPPSLGDTDMGLANEELPLEGAAAGEPAAESAGETTANADEPAASAPAAPSESSEEKPNPA